MLMQMGAQELMPSLHGGKQAGLNKVGHTHQDHQERYGADLPLSAYYRTLHQ